MSIRVFLTGLCAIALCAAPCGCSRHRSEQPSPQAYAEAVTAFYTGLSAMQTTQEVLAREKFDRVIALVPQEPAAWADLLMQRLER